DQEAERPAWTWLPDEAPLAMPRQPLDNRAAAPVAPSAATPATSPAAIGRRRMILAALTVVVTALAAIAPFILYARHGFTALEMVSFGLFLVLIAAIGCWFSSAAIGFWVLLTGREQADLKFAP